MVSDLRPESPRCALPAAVLTSSIPGVLALAALSGCASISQADLRDRLLTDDLHSTDAPSSSDDPLTSDGSEAPGAWVQLAVGSRHSCGRRANGTLWCWGRGAAGERGDGELLTAINSPSQVVQTGQTKGGEAWSDWRDVSAGGQHTCGVRSNGSAWCWGRGTNGQRGDGSKTNQRENPAQVLAGGDPSGSVGWSDWVSVSAGGGHSCGIRQDRSAWCWGSGSHGQRGSGEHRAFVRTTPERVLNDTNEHHWTDWELLSLGDQHTCGIRADGSLWCWGDDWRGQLGVGGLTVEDGKQARPREVVSPVADALWMQVSAGSSHTCGILDDGTLWCWGWGDYGQLGDGGTSADHVQPSPTLVINHDGSHDDTWEQVTAGHSHTCARRFDGSAWCWGSQANGMLGTGVDRPAGQPYPVAVDSEETTSIEPWTDWTLVLAGGSHSCGLRDGRGAWCWGNGEDGQRGDGASTASQTLPSIVQD